MSDTITISDVLSVEYPEQPAWSHDGRFVSVLIYEDTGRSLVCHNVEADETWRCRPDNSFVTDFSWRPDGQQCLIRSEDGEISLLGAETREVHYLTNSHDEALVWSNDGSRFACYRDGHPSVLDVERSTSTTFDAPSRGPYLGEDRMFAWRADDRYLAYRFVDDGTKQVGVLDVDAGTLCWRTTSAASCYSPAWLDDDRLVFERMRDSATVREFVAVDPDHGNETVLLREADPDLGIVSRGPPAVSPDGSQLAVTLPLDGWDHVYVLDPNTEDHRQLTVGPFEDKGLADSTPVWLDDETLVFASNRCGPESRGIYEVNVSDGTVDPLVETPGTNVLPIPSPNGDRIAYLHADSTHSPELRLHERARETTEPGVRITTTAVDEWPLEPIEPERVELNTEDGFEIPAFLVTPPDRSEDTTHPAVVWVHGGPMRQMRDGWHPIRAYGIAYAVHQFLAARGYVGLLVNYRGGIGYGKEFRQAIAADPGREVDDDVVAAADYVKRLDYVDEDAVAIWGLSYGGYATLRVLGNVPAAFDLGVNLAGVADRRSFESWATDTKYPPAESSLPTILGGTHWDAPDEWTAASPISQLDACEVPLYNFHGTGDRYVNFEQLELLIERLVGTSVEFEAEMFPGETHVFSSRAVWERTLRKIVAAFEKHLTDG